MFAFVSGLHTAIPRSAIPALPRKKVVVIGGGFAGGSTASMLQDKFDVTLVDRKPYFENVCALYRIMVEPKLLFQNRIPHEQYVPRATVLVDAVEKVDGSNVYTKNSVIPYDYLVISSGSRYEAPFPVNDSRTVSLMDGSSVAAVADQIASAASVAVIGGGPAGLEVAAELAEAYPSKPIHLVCSGDKLLSKLCSAAQLEAEKHIQSYPNVNVLRNQRVVAIDSDGSVITSLGKRIQSTLSFLCLGFRANTEFLRPNFSEALHLNGTVRVRDTLQVDGHPNIFALGDVAGIEEEKLAQNAFRHAKVVAQNIEQLAHGSSSLQTYRPENRRMAIMMGRENALVVDGEKVSTGRSYARLKQSISLSAYILPFFNVVRKTGFA